MTRTTQTPGAAQKKAVAKAADDGQAQLDAVLGTQTAAQDDPLPEVVTESLSESESESLSEQSYDFDQLLQNQEAILNNQVRIESKIDQLLKAGGIEAPKKKRWVQGKHGLEHKEVS